MTQQVPVKIGDQLFQREDGAAFGAGVGIHAHELLVEVEGVGQAVIPAAAIKAVHDGKLRLVCRQTRGETAHTQRLLELASRRFGAFGRRRSRGPRRP